MSQEKLKLLKNMKRVRYLEERAAELYSSTKIRGFLHLYVGQEAVAAGTMPHLDPEDAVVAAYREHGHALLRGVSARSIMAEMFGKVEGCSRGRGGSMHLFDARTHFFGGSAIVAGGLPLAVGIALADKMKKTKYISACFFGDGATAEGEFQESLNLAALWKLPVLFLCENNLYAMGTALCRHQSQIEITIKARAYNIPASQVDGMDVMAVSEAVKKATAHIREENGPYFLEFLTYRFRAHSMFDPELYRKKEEVEEWKKKDPIKLFSEKLKSENVLNDETHSDMNKSIKEEIEDAITFAENGHKEKIEDLERFVYGGE